MGGVLLGILGGGVPPVSPNPDPVSDQNFPHLFLDVAFKTHSVFRPGRWIPQKITMQWI